MSKTLAVSKSVDSDLLQRLEDFQLDDPHAALTFSRRLARENGWTHDFALRVVDEYKRFVYLAMTTGHEVTPSDEVDQAWHLHLTYTRSYWDEMCGEVLGRPLHHGPTKGGEAEGERFEDQYERTLESYRQAFGQAPPSDIWPPAEVRFGEAAYFVRVNTRRRRRARPVLLGGLAAVGLMGLAPLANAAKEEEWFFTVFSCIVIGAVITVILKVIFKAATGKDWKSGDHGCSSGGFWGGCGGDSGCGSSCGGGCGGGCGG